MSLRQTGILEIVELLLDSGAKVDTRENDGETPCLMMPRTAGCVILRAWQRFGTKGGAIRVVVVPGRRRIPFPHMTHHSLTPASTVYTLLPPFLTPRPSCRNEQASLPGTIGSSPPFR